MGRRHATMGSWHRSAAPSTSTQRPRKGNAGVSAAAKSRRNLATCALSVIVSRPALSARVKGMFSASSLANVPAGRQKHPTASARALEIGALNCRSVASLLVRKPAAAARDGGTATLFKHANLRGAGYYH
jgi:hypothetical protein